MTTACLILYQERTPRCASLLERAVESAYACCDYVHVLDNTDDKLPYTEARLALLAMSTAPVIRYLDYDDYLTTPIEQERYDLVVAGAECNRRPMLSRTVEGGIFNRTLQTSCLQWDREVFLEVAQHTPRIWEYWSAHEAIQKGCNIKVQMELCSVYNSRWSQVQLTFDRQKTREQFKDIYRSILGFYPEWRRTAGLFSYHF